MMLLLFCSPLIRRCARRIVEGRLGDGVRNQTVTDPARLKAVGSEQEMTAVRMTRLTDQETRERKDNKERERCDGDDP